MSDFKDWGEFESEFYERFNLDKIEFLSRYDKSFEDKNNLNSLREKILISELKDFQWLVSTVDEIDEIQEKLLKRFKIEQRNSFDGRVSNIYIVLLMGTEDLKDFVKKKQISFYQKRIQEIEKELNSKK